jgi:hypothetical protein
MADPNTPFTWSSLIPQAVSLGAKVIGDKLAPNPALMSAQTGQQNLAEQQRQFNIQQQLSQQKLGQANAIRQSTMPALYTNLGMSADKARAMAAQYGSQFGSTQAAPGAQPSAYSFTPGTQAQPQQTQSSGPGLGSTIAKSAASVGLGLAPALIGHALGLGGTAAAGAGTAGAGAATAGGLGSTIAGLATNPFTIAGAGALAAGLIWKKSQVHPAANTWVQGEQNPFDQSWQKIEQSGLPPDQQQQLKAQNAKAYLTDLAAFAQQGSHEAIVARQAADTFRKYYGDPTQFGVQLPF